MNFNFRICGEETLSLTNSATKVFTFGEKTLTTSLSDSDRYFELTQGTFQSYFAVSPRNDPCTIEEYELTIDEVEITTASTSSSGSNLFDLDLGSLQQQATGDQIALTGSLGSYKIRVDKTKQSGIKNVHIKAITRGLIEKEQAIKFRICPEVGGTQVTPSAQRILASIDVGASGRATEIGFSAWSIQDIVEGCGVFDKYSISGDSNTMRYVQYPMPGYSYTSHCTTISSCLKIKVTNTNEPISLDFSLNLHLKYGQDSTSIPVSIQIYPCDTAQLSASGNPPEIVLKNTD